MADVVARHSWTHGRKFLLVPYHMIGARDMESAILGRYADFVRQQHPAAPIPGCYLAEGLFRDARELRERLGDAPFFARLNQGAASSGGGWGEFGNGWDAARFEAGLLEPPNGEERSRLIGDLITQYFSAYRSLAGSSGSFVSLDDGLSIMSRHAQAAELVVITPLATHEITEDLAACLARGRVFQPEGWDIVRQLFQAKKPVHGWGGLPGCRNA